MAASRGRAGVPPAWYRGPAASSLACVDTVRCDSYISRLTVRTASNESGGDREMLRKIPSTKRTIRLITAGLMTAMILFAAGCGVMLTTAAVSTPQSILKAVRTPPDRVTVEVAQVRVPEDDKQLAAELWQAADEQRIELEIRNRLVSNGFRVGVISGIIPDALARALNLQSESKGDENEQVITDDSAAAKVTRRVMQLKRREPASIQCSDVHSSLNLLLNTDSGVQGKSYSEVQGVYSLRAESVPGQKVRVQLVPELQFGELRNRYAGSEQGMIMFTPSRERKVFDDMKIIATLAPGEILLITGVPDTAGSLGSAFHSRRIGDVAEQKLVMVRVVQVPDSEILADATLPGE